MGEQVGRWIGDQGEISHDLIEWRSRLEGLNLPTSAPNSYVPMFICFTLGIWRFKCKSQHSNSKGLHILP